MYRLIAEAVTVKYSNCNYNKGDQRTSSPIISPCLKGDKLSPKSARLLYLGEEAEILLYKSLKLRKFKNGIKIFRKHLVITSSNLILASYKRLNFLIPKRWIERDIIPLSDIAAIEGKIKYSFMYTGQRPFLIIRSSQNDFYEIELSPFEQNIHEINEIADIINRFNPQVVLTLNNLNGNDPIYSERDRRLLCLVPFLMFLLGLALWRLFQYVSIHGLN